MQEVLLERAAVVGVDFDAYGPEVVPIGGAYGRILDDRGDEVADVVVVPVVPLLEILQPGLREQVLCGVRDRHGVVSDGDRGGSRSRVTVIGFVVSVVFHDLLEIGHPADAFAPVQELAEGAEGVLERIEQSVQGGCDPVSVEVVQPAQRHLVGDGIERLGVYRIEIQFDDSPFGCRDVGEIRPPVRCIRSIAEAYRRQSLDPGGVCPFHIILGYDGVRAAVAVCGDSSVSVQDSVLGHRC